jgi:hypothetical protein
MYIKDNSFNLSLRIIKFVETSKIKEMAGQNLY